MKKLIILSVLAFFSIQAFSQSDLNEALEFITVPGGVQNIDKKVLKDPAPIGLPYVAIKFRTASIKQFQEGKGKEVDKGRTYAMLLGIDSADFQEITNEFAKIFMQKLTDVGVKLIDLERVQKTKLYKDYSAEKTERNFNHRNYGTADVYTQDHLPFFYYGANMFKLMSFVKETDAGIASLRLTVDFVEFNTEISKSFQKDAAGYGWDVTTTHFSANSFPTIKVTSDMYAEGMLNQAAGVGTSGAFMMMNPKSFMSAVFAQKKPIYSPYKATIETYDNKIPKFANTFRVFGGAMELGTFVLSPEKEAYKKAALAALTKYADYVVAIIKSYNEGKK